MCLSHILSLFVCGAIISDNFFSWSYHLLMNIKFSQNPLHICSLVQVAPKRDSFQKICAGLTQWHKFHRNQKDLDQRSGRMEEGEPCG